VNLKEIKEMINLMNDNNLSEFEVEKEGLRIKLRKNTGQSIEGIASPAVTEKERISENIKTAEAQIQQQKATNNSVEIKAPMVGTFYRAPSPEAPPYVEIGQIIEPGQVICIIEAMKLMNEIKSEIKGKIVEILVDNAEPVEFGQPMFLIEPL